VLIAQCGVFFERFVNDAFELSRESGIEADGRDRRMIENAVENFRGTVTAECRAPSGHFVEDDAKAKEIAASVEIAAAGLFRRHVGDGAESGAGAGEIGGVEGVIVVFAGFAGGGFGGRGGFCGHGFGQTEIENFCLTARGDEKIGGFDVAMDDAFRMSGIKSVGNLNGERQGFVEGKRAAGDGVLESSAIEKLHDDERMRVGFADFVDGADVGVIEGGGGLGFALKAFERLRVAGDAVGKKFQRYEAVELAVFRFVHHAHAAAAEFFDDTEMRNAAADQAGRIRHEGTILVR